MFFKIKKNSQNYILITTKTDKQTFFYSSPLFFFCDTMNTANQSNVEDTNFSKFHFQCNAPPH